MEQLNKGQFKNDEPVVLMSPLLSQKIENLENQISNLNSKYDKIYSYLEDNRQMYLSMLKMINDASNDNNKILIENKKLYTDAIKKIENNEKQNIEEIRPIINNMLMNNKSFEKNILSPIFQSRVYNRYWRMNHIQNTSSNKINAILGLHSIPEFNALQLNEKILNTN